MGGLSVPPKWASCWGLSSNCHRKSQNENPLIICVNQKGNSELPRNGMCARLSEQLDPEGEEQHAMGTCTEWMGKGGGHENGCKDGFRGKFGEKDNDS